VRPALATPLRSAVTGRVLHAATVACSSAGAIGARVCPSSALGEVSPAERIRHARRGRDGRHGWWRRTVSGSDRHDRGERGVDL